MKWHQWRASACDSVCFVAGEAAEKHLSQKQASMKHFLFSQAQKLKMTKMLIERNLCSNDSVLNKHVMRATFCDTMKLRECTAVASVAKLERSSAASVARLRETTIGISEMAKCYSKPSSVINK